VELREGVYRALLAGAFAGWFVCTVAAQNEHPATVAHTTTPMPMATITMKERDHMGRFGLNLPADFQAPASEVAERLLREYGSVFVCRGGCVPPNKVIFQDQAEVASFQESIKTRTETISEMPMTLQAPAMAALVAAIEEAKALNLRISPRDYDSAARSYNDSVGLWASRVEPALVHWTLEKKISDADAQHIRGLPPFDQVSEVLKLEKQKIYFAKDLKKSIIYSVAPPGTSQHLSMLAFDVVEYDEPAVRSILARHGWFQTVVSDLPHFTYIGVSESELKNLGLKKKKSGGRVFWIPDL